MDKSVRRQALELADAEGFVRDDAWRAGVSELPPARNATLGSGRGDVAVRESLDACLREEPLEDSAMLALFTARDADVETVCEAADELRRRQVGDAVSYVINRNINYTNVCQYSCRFCAFSKGGGEVAPDAPLTISTPRSCIAESRRRRRWAPQRSVCRGASTLITPDKPISIFCAL